MAEDGDESASRPAAPDAAYGRALDEMAGLLRAEAQAWAARVRLMSELDDLATAGSRAGTPLYPHLEMAGSWSVSQLTAERWRGEAERLVSALPITLDLLETGALLVHQAKVLLQRTKHCSLEIARAVEAELLPAAIAWCPADIAKRVDRAVLRREAEQSDAAAAEQRHAVAAASRRTFVKPLHDGLGMAGAVLPAEQLVAWQAALDRLELRERLADRAAGLERTAEQRRADLFAALPAMVLANAGGDGAPWTFGPERLAAQVVLNVHVPVTTVLETGKHPGSLDRFGAISAAHVRLIRPHSYRRVFVDAGSGRPIAVDDRPTPADGDPAAAREQILAMLRPDTVTDLDEPQHDPSARLARLVDLRDAHCCGPGCSSSHTERDHLEPYPAGPTNARNLGRLSPRCHHAKHHGWTLTRHDDGSTSWTSSLGRRYHRPPPHDPPPKVDLWQELPPIRPRPTAPAPKRDSTQAPPADDSQAAAGQATGPTPPAAPPPVSPQVSRRDELDDEPPF